MTRDIFKYPPSVEVLKLLVPGSLKQNLVKAIRLWVILHSIYGGDNNEATLELEEEFSFLQWRDLFFQDATKHHARDNVPTLHHEECRCARKLSEWLFTSNLSIEKNKWCQSFHKYYSIESDELENLLLTGSINNTDQDSSDNQNSQKYHGFSKTIPDGRLFAVTCRNLKDYDFRTLVNLGWLNIKKVDNQDKYVKVKKIPQIFWDCVENLGATSKQFTHEELSALNNSLSKPINGIQRFFIHTEYIVHPQLYIHVKLLQKQLKQIWSKDKTSFIKLTYKSAKLYQDTVTCIVYPVCIYYYQRGFYLFAYGQTPQRDSEHSWNEINWYDYRLDRILKLDELPTDLSNSNIPKSFITKCWGKYPPSPQDIKDEMLSAWGFDIHKPPELLVLRFNQYFYANNIQGTERDEMFTKISQKQVEFLIKNNTSSFPEQQYLFSKLNSNKNSVYRKIYYRQDDNNIVMRLRAWGQNVEVILPWSLRQRMKEDMEATYQLYR
ncbi:TIGR03985 family CRISPR-associated protein [Aetokthonos hydrillicola Thurmond2011]|jgi:CRISPR-associated protein (TIGR03985 family)|uniref:TIGR03985 family CRISPR-associated protein n=1 Tax=Aetokthonos hydrillicola Thurmond2011 TaxID=2712845 RepID=A0AAP5IA12_9CYAN|nr:TIGR03985 family CRISPR-associated protein [Aetokthonos hydrillicola]MBO3460374.1 TIGR03985 family CRISPR-associated protein [Aetokthonos hydrillicola CCALA 1050]MBW4584506.1 TIGR03985 family CRISPR-associated protein [Aetokthonos hydrillicola CCALA 1050]MDR9896469.1 TIGR03985 family CRISPR-associated protein [Aetokthonos hydrillicola Thurmond2011]